MRKTSKISLIIALAVSPLTANAGDRLGTALTTLSTVAETNNETDSSGVSVVKVASENYVRGAYNVAAGKISAVASAVNTLNGDDSTAGSVLNAIKTNAASASYDSSETYSSGTVGKAIQTLQSASTDAATKTGVENLLKSVTISTDSGSVYVADSWNNGTTGSIGTVGNYTQVSFVTPPTNDVLTIDSETVDYDSAQPSGSGS